MRHVAAVIKPLVYSWAARAAGRARARGGSGSREKTLPLEPLSQEGWWDLHCEPPQRQHRACPQKPGRPDEDV